MNPPEPFTAATTTDSQGMSEASAQVPSRPRPDPPEAGPSGPEPLGRAESVRSSGALDPELAELAEEITRRLQAGDVVDPEDYAARHPEWAGSIRRLMPILREMADLGRSVVGAGDERPLRALGESPIEGGRILGDFRILGEIGRGGMGIVYEAEQLSLGRRVALKVLPLATAMDPRALQRFQLEAQAVAWLQHPRIVPVYAVGSLGDVPYYAMQFIEGASLAELIAELRRLEGLESDHPANASRSERHQLPGARPVVGVVHSVARGGRGSPVRHRAGSRIPGVRPPGRARPHEPAPEAARRGLDAGAGLRAHGGLPGRTGGRGAGVRA